MVHALSRATGMNEELLTEDFKSVFAKRGGVEYPFSVQELDLCRNMSLDATGELVRIARYAFSITRDKHLQLYPGVKETLVWAAKQGIPVVGVTNAPMKLAENRLKHLHLDSLFSGLAAWTGYTLPEENSPWIQAIRQKEEKRKRKPSIKKFWHLEKEELKPSPVVYLRIISDLNISHKETYIIGDSLEKDIRPALEIGAIGIWAEYGNVYERKNFETLLKITHWNKQKISSVYDQASTTPHYAVNSFAELQNIVEPLQLKLPGVEQLATCSHNSIIHSDQDLVESNITISNTPEFGQDTQPCLPGLEKA
jgi:Predicted phosphatases